jgi:hypothetical protein
VYLLSPAFSEETNCHAAWAIHHGVYHNQDSQSLVGEAGGLSMLLSHISSNMESLRTNALLALSSTISAHVKNKQKLLGDKEAMHLLETLTEQYEEGEENVTPHKTLKKILQEFK